jgi:outer membrane protein OmpA-like peptidoglycan-associated protein
MKIKSLIGTFILISCANLAFAQDASNWLSASGAQWKNGDGTLCWRSGTWSPATASKGCDGAATPPVIAPVAKQPSVVIAVNQSARGVELILPNQVLFEVGKATLNISGSAPHLDRMAELILTKTKKPVLIEGHTDAQGASTLNQQLSDQRAKVIFDALIARNVPADRMIAKGAAATRPVGPNDLEAGRRLNRRTEVVVLDETVENLMRGEPSNSFEQAASIIKRELEAGGGKQ